MTTPTLTYRADGLTDEVTDCGHCGRANLKHTVRMVLIDADGNRDGETYMGVVCAAQMTGRKAAEIRTEAKQADRARFEAVREVYNDWRDRHSVWFQALRDATIGRDFVWAGFQAWRDGPEFAALEQAWLAENPAPPSPWAGRSS